MVRRSHGIRNNTRKILRKSPRDRGMPSLGRIFQSFEAGDKAAVVIEPSVHGGMPHRRFQGLTGTIVGKQGDCYVLDVKDGGKPKQLVIRPEHLKRQG